MLNEAANNNGVTHVVNNIIVFNEVPNSNEATRVGNDMCLSAMGAKQFSMAAI